MDRDLVEQARRGDREAFAVLVHQVSDTALRGRPADPRDHGLAEDALQNALVLAGAGSRTCGNPTDSRRPRTSPLGLVIAGVDEDPMDPRLESVGFPQVRDPAPGEHEGVLQRVLGETVVAQDPLGDRVELVADLVHQDGERLTIPAAGLLDEVSIHLGLRWPRPGWPRTTNMTAGSSAKRSGAYSPAMSEPAPGDDLRKVLIGEHAGLSQFRRALRHIPSEPRCKLCLAPFSGGGGVILRHLGFGRFPGNPAICTNCIRQFSKPGSTGAEIPISLLFADVRGSTGSAND